MDWVKIGSVGPGNMALMELMRQHLTEHHGPGVHVYRSTGGLCGETSIQKHEGVLLYGEPKTDQPEPERCKNKVELKCPKCGEWSPDNEWINRASGVADRSEHAKEVSDLKQTAAAIISKLKRDKSALQKRNEHLDKQIDSLASVLLQEFGGPTQNESACEMAVRLLREFKQRIAELEGQLQDEKE